MSRLPPSPIIDNLNHIDDPFEKTTFSARAFSLKNIEGADKNLEYALKFLYSFKNSAATFNSYRREIERLLQWCWRFEEVSAFHLTPDYIEKFIAFCFDPPLEWIGTKNVSRFTTHSGERFPNPDWRPFVATVSKSDFRKGKGADPREFAPSQASIKATYTALSSFYDYLLQEKLVSNNPVASSRQKNQFIHTKPTKPISRQITALQWTYVIKTIESMAKEEPLLHERTIFIMHCLHDMHLRISELVHSEHSHPTMGDFRLISEKWYFEVTNKEKKKRSILLSDEMLNSLIRYREHLGITPLPTPDENRPLISKTKGQGPVSSTRQIRKIVQMCFDKAYNTMLKDDLYEEAKELNGATVHWLRLKEPKSKKINNNFKESNNLPTQNLNHFHKNNLSQDNLQEKNVEETEQELV